ncbi:hypothetical protein M8C21_005110 [Ambrosia artemisiifolia]|uniref:Uncharacterized protein n=1 Tax=Ambrosia artemisiifolia TaxID=4212 RepID=A0AAD5GUZ1_AMBAR|nr:hypothetical protein M8C21_005110 [Ambrosia artemisiifolia]
MNESVWNRAEYTVSKRRQRKHEQPEFSVREKTRQSDYRRRRRHHRPYSPCRQIVDGCVDCRGYTHNHRSLFMSQCFQFPTCGYEKKSITDAPDLLYKCVSCCKE